MSDSVIVIFQLHPFDVLVVRIGKWGKYYYTFVIFFSISWNLEAITLATNTLDSITNERDTERIEKEKPYRKKYILKQSFDSEATAFISQNVHCKQPIRDLCLHIALKISFSYNVFFSLWPGQKVVGKHIFPPVAL